MFFSQEVGCKMFSVVFFGQEDQRKNAKGVLCGLFRQETERKVCSVILFSQEAGRKMFSVVLFGLEDQRKQVPYEKP